MAIDKVALASELTNDPSGLGYINGDPLGNTEKLNLIRTAIKIDRDLVPSHEVLDATVVADYNDLTAAEKERYALFISAGEINVRSANTRAAFLAMFAGGTATRTNLGAIQTKDSSRAEQLFGVGTRVSINRIRSVS